MREWRPVVAQFHKHHGRTTIVKHSGIRSMRDIRTHYIGTPGEPDYLRHQTMVKLAWWAGTLKSDGIVRLKSTGQVLRYNPPSPGYLRVKAGLLSAAA